MILRFQTHLAAIAVWLTLMAFLNQRVSFAEDHVVPLTDLQHQLRAASAAQAKDRADIERVLSLPAARDLLRKSNLGPEQVQRAVAMLSPDELSRLAGQARLAEKDVQGGFLVGILALIGLVVVILIVLAVVHSNKNTTSSY